MSVEISIIIPSYNRLWCLPDAIESCRKSQSRAEIIVVDDGSTDGTWEWLQSQPDVRAFRQPNQGKDWAVNFGLSHAVGEWVRFLDSDDLLPPGANDLQLQKGRQSNADVVAAGYMEWNSLTNSRRTIDWVVCDDFVSQQLGECSSSHYSAYVFRRNFIADVPHRPEYGSLDDRMFIIEVALKDPVVAACAEPCLIHRQHEMESLQKHRGLSRATAHFQYLSILRRTVRTLNNTGGLNLRRRRAVAKSAWSLARWIANTFPEDACVLAKWVFLLDPDFIPPEKGLLGMLYRYIGFERTETLRSLRRIVVNQYRSKALPSDVFHI